MNREEERTGDSILPTGIPVYHFPNETGIA